MAAKSDFAQKLLHDLRLRKERMGASQSSNRNNTMTKDTYRNPGNVQRGSQQTRTLESIGAGGSGRPLGIKESSQQIVTYAGGRHARSESIGDLSMAFTYAVKNGGKLVNMDFSGSSNTNTMINFLHQIGRRSLDVGKSQNGASLVKHRPSNGAVPAPALTSIQIKEISKGVQNLYEILRSSSSRTNADRYSVEVGKELLKGARGLEESLRMLVNLQEASELMISPQRKSRVTLLEVDEDDEDDRSKIVDHNQVALPRFSFDKPSKKSHLALTDASSKLSTHRRSASCGADSLSGPSTALGAKNSSSRSEKGRISNVIAKLMGLEEVPGKLDSQSIRNDSKNAEPRVRHPEKQVNKVSKPAKDALVLSIDRKYSQQSQDSNIKGEPGPQRTTVTVGRQQNNSQRLGQLQEKPEKQQKSETKEKIQQKRRSPEVAANPRQERVDKKKTTRMEKSNEIKLISRNSQTQEPEKRTQKSKQDSQKIKHNHNQVKSKDWTSKEPQIQHSEENLKAEVATPKAQESEPERAEGNVQPPLVKEKPVTRKKADSLALHRTEAPRKKDEVLKRRNGTFNNLGRPTKHKFSVLQETKTKDVQRLGSISSKQEKTSSKEPTAPLYDSTTNAISQVPVCKDDIKNDPQATLETVVAAGKYAGSNERSMKNGNLSEDKHKKAFYSGIQVALTEQEKQLKEILIKDQLFLSTAEALFKLNIPIGFLHVDDHNHLGNQTKLMLDCGYEILRRKARSQELSIHPYMKPSIGATTIRFLDDLVKQLYKDLESLRLYGRNAQNEDDEADYLHHMLERDIRTTNPDINSFWEFGWHMTTYGFVEKDEFVNDVEQDVLHRLVDEIIDDLLGMELPF